MERVLRSSDTQKKKKARRAFKKEVGAYLDGTKKRGEGEAAGKILKFCLNKLEKPAPGFPRPSSPPEKFFDEKKLKNFIASLGAGNTGKTVYCELRAFFKRLKEAGKLPLSAKFPEMTFEPAVSKTGGSAHYHLFDPFSHVATPNMRLAALLAMEKQLRPFQMVMLLGSDYDPIRRELKVAGKKEPVKISVKSRLFALISQMDKFANRRREYIFCKDDGKPISTKTLSRYFRSALHPEFKNIKLQNLTVQNRFSAPGPGQMSLF